MYSIILSIEAYMLLLFSFITIVILLRKQFKQWMYTSLYILSMSDLLFSILTAGVLLINSNIEMFNDMVLINNNTWNGKDQKDTFSEFHKILMNIIKQNNFNATQECNIMHIMLHYGMFLIPFTNSFVSLLMFSAQCNLNIFNFKNQCFKFFEFEKHIEKDNKINKSDLQSIEKSEEFQFDLKPTLIQCYKRKLVKKFQFYNGLKGDNKMIVIILVINQWIIPTAVTGLLYSIAYDNANYSEGTETAICFENYFLFNDFHYGVKTVNATHNYSSVYETPLHKNYTDTELISTLNASNAQVNEIISKVQSIVHSALDGTYNISQYVSHVEPYNMTKLVNIMKDLEFNTHTGILKHSNDNINSTESFMKETEELEYESAFNSTSSNMTNLLSNIQSENNTTEYDKEEQLFNYLMTNSSENILLEEDNSDNEIIISTTKTSISNIVQTNNIGTVEELVGTTINNNASVITNDQIYADILKRIHDSIHHTMKTNYKKQPKSKILEEDLSNNSIMNKSNVSSVIQFIAYKSNNASNKTSISSMDKYSIPVKFLKLYLLLLLFIIYFLPILFCIILHQRGKLNCQFLLDKLKAKDKMSNTSNDNSINNISSINFKESVDSKRAFTSRQDSIISTETTKKTQQNVAALEQIEIFNENSTDEENKTDERNESGERRMELNMIVQMENTLKLFDTMKMSLLCGTMLWTPILFEILSKVFAQISVPEWLFNTTYLVAIMFTIIRNLFNLKMIKLQDMDASITKTNSIHPII